jgi:proline iminopeptidase
MTTNGISIIVGIAFWASFFLVACNGQDDQGPPTPQYLQRFEKGVQDGGIRRIKIGTPKDSFFVWTKQVGYNPQLRVLLLTGGPGCTHEYFECFESFFPDQNIEFIYYDQLGCGFSDNPNDTSYWDLDRYVDELEQVRKALRLDSTNCVLLGHSWGGILAMEYAVKYQQHLKGLVISNMMSSCPKYGQYAEEVLALQMDSAVLHEIRSLEAVDDFSNPRYMKLLNENYYQHHICKIPLKDWPDPINRSFAGINSSLYVTMQGPSEFGIAGKLTHWDRSGDMKNITIPCLTIGAKDDTMDPAHMKWMAEQMPRGSHLYCPNGSHMAFYDDQVVYFDGLMRWLKGI